VLVAMAAVSAISVIIFGGPIQIVAGLFLSLYLPGQLAVDALLPSQSFDKYLRALLTAALSLATTMLVGLVIAVVRLKFDATIASLGLLIACVCLAGAALARAMRRADGEEDVVGSARRRRVTWPYVLASLPALALTVLLATQLVGALHHRVADSYYTELGVGPSQGRESTILVRSLERKSMDYRYELRIGNTVAQSTRFSLQPGQRRQFTLLKPSVGRIEVRLFLGEQRSPYRDVIVRPH
jgi:uncharacterized membrane protein